MSKRQSFKDPVTGFLLNAEEMDTEIPQERLWWGRRLGYTDEQVKDVWLADSRRPRALKLDDLDRVMTKAEAEAQQFWGAM